ncbi:STAS domain-containing protein [Candidatus Uabimicrobium sp. HlEnr_7]|uniref:STAS domain-containing protein n=1 Tax=Candidatus Uabimicrobium helgolandensis TaxID=3095367 RepID=UPI0035589423
MTIEVEDLSKHSYLVKLQGSLDFESAKVVKPKFVEITNLENIKLLVVNMEEVDFLASEGLASFLVALMRMEKKDGQVWLVKTQPQVMRVFKLTRVENRFRFFDSLEEVHNNLP